MPWQDRLKEAAYTDPEGRRYTFSYEDVSRQVEKKTTAFSFPDAPGSLVQDLGPNGYQYPLRVIFHGPEYDIEAAQFEAGLLVPGVGQLEHPVYGKKNVVPFGTITRRDDLKTAGNQAPIEVIFFETILDTYPASQDDKAGVSESLISIANDSSATIYDEIVSVASVLEKVTLSDQVLTLVDQADALIRPIAETVKAVERVYSDIYSSIVTGIDTIIGQPLVIAYQIQQLIMAPARAETSIGDRLEAYTSLASQIIDADKGETRVTLDNTDKNTFATRDVFASSSLAAMQVSVLNNQFSTKPEAISSAESIIITRDSLSGWRDDNLSLLEIVIDGQRGHDELAAVAATAGYLVEISFSLLQERSFFLTRPRHLVELCAELYGELDEKYDFFIDSNQIFGEELLELPAGRRIVYYV